MEKTELELAQDRFAREQLEDDERLQQSQSDRAEIKIKLLDNGLLIKTGPSWLAFPTWKEASEFVGARIKALEKKRLAAPR